MPSDKKFKSNDSCTHPICTDCFAQYIRAKLEDSVAIIKCPALDCEQLLDPLLCRTIISAELFTNWCDSLCNSSLFVYERCYCPYQNSSALIINECGGSLKKTKCPNCKRFFRYTCKVPWHAGYWCSESRQRRDANDVSFGDLVEKFKWTRCPRCGQAVERRDGCRNVVCRQKMGNTQQKLEVNFPDSEQVNSEHLEQVANELGSSEEITCEICIEPMSSAKEFKNNDGCTHPFCTDCFAKYIRAKLEENVAIIKCPALKCEQLLDPLLCRTIISVELFTYWCDFLCDSSLLVFEKCYCPYRNCSALIINECGGTVRKTKCPNCKRFFCYTCKVPWHAGYWCSESRQRRDANDVRFGKLVEKFKWTRCPHCGQAVERIDGCRMVICRCRTSFCHICGKKYHSGRCDETQRFCSCQRCGLLLLVLVLVIFPLILLLLAIFCL